jgi:hypothetical protein
MGWLRFERFRFDGVPQAVRAGEETVIWERVSTLERPQRLAHAVPNARGKVLVALAAHAGFGPGTLGPYSQGDALPLRNLPQAGVQRGSLQHRAPQSYRQRRKAYLKEIMADLADRVVDSLRGRGGIKIVRRGSKRDCGQFVPSRLAGEKPPCLKATSRSTSGASSLRGKSWPRLPAPSPGLAPTPSLSLRPSFETRALRAPRGRRLKAQSGSRRARRSTSVTRESECSRLANSSWKARPVVKMRRCHGRSERSFWTDAKATSRFRESAGPCSS